MLSATVNRFSWFSAAGGGDVVVGVGGEVLEGEVDGFDFVGGVDGGGDLFGGS